MDNHEILVPTLYFCYWQFTVYDLDVAMPVCVLEDAHFDQGFARRESVVTFRTMIQFGDADVNVVVSDYEADANYQRIVAVPFLVTSGTVVVSSPEEIDSERQFTVPPGYYRLVAAQAVISDDVEDAAEVIDLFLEARDTPLERSQILVADDELSPPEVFVETAKIPYED